MPDRIVGRELREVAAHLPFAELFHSAAAVPPHFDEPKIWITTGQLRLNRFPAQVTLGDRGHAEYGYAGSASDELGHALVALFGEGAERFALLPLRNRDTLLAYDQLREPGLDPARIVAGDKRRVPRRGHLRMRWSRVQDAISGAPLYVPAQLIDVPYIFPTAETILRSPITTGAAAGISKNDCIERGLLEAIERDAFMTAWLGRLRLREIPRLTPSSRDSALKQLVDSCHSFGLEAVFREIPTAFPARVVGVFLFDESDAPTPRVVVGASADYSIAEAGRKALLEAIQLRSWLRSDKRLRPTTSDCTASLGLPVRTIRQRAKLLFRADYAEAVKEYVASPMTARDELAASHLAELLASAKANGVTVLASNLTQRLPALIRDLGVEVWKIITPELQPLYLNDFAQDVAWHRLRAAGFSQSRLNPLAHPFL